MFHVFDSISIPVCSQLTKEEQDKLDVKAPHKSHWKHLLFVVNQDPTFLEVHRHSKVSVQSKLRLAGGK